jgi:hypothetical protein
MPAGGSLVEWSPTTLKQSDNTQTVSEKDFHQINALNNIWYHSLYTALH